MVTAVGGLEGRAADQHLKDQHAQRPPVRGQPGAPALDDLWRLCVPPACLRERVTDKTETAQRLPSPSEV